MKINRIVKKAVVSISQNDVLDLAQMAEVSEGYATEMLGDARIGQQRAEWAANVEKYRAWRVFLNELWVKMQ